MLDSIFTGCVAIAPATTGITVSAAGALPTALDT